MPTQAEIRQQITTDIVNALEAGTPPWRMPWVCHPNAGLPTNVVSGKRYSGINPIILQVAANRRGFRSKHWGTYQQWQQVGCQVQRRPSDVPQGQWGTNIVFYKPVTKVDVNDEGEEIRKSFPVLRTFTVFNADQVDGNDIDRYRVQEDFEQNLDFVGYEPAEHAVAAIPADIRFGGDRAFYSVNGDYIHMPTKGQFVDEREFYGTIFHELAHWSESRTGWKASYAEGELRAEITACFILAELGVPQSQDLTNHHAYLQSWLKQMKEEPKFIFWASTAANRACDYLLSFSRQPAAIIV